MRDAIDKYYHVCEFNNDDINKVVLLLKKQGIKKRPSKIYKDLANLNVKKYEKHFDKIIGA